MIQSCFIFKALTIVRGGRYRIWFLSKFVFHVCLQINKMFTLVAEYARNETVSVGMLARAHDMRYQAQVFDYFIFFLPEIRQFDWSVFGT